MRPQAGINRLAGHPRLAAWAGGCSRSHRRAALARTRCTPLLCDGAGVHAAGGHAAGRSCTGRSCDPHVSLHHGYPACRVPGQCTAGLSCLVSWAECSRKPVGARAADRSGGALLAGDQWVGRAGMSEITCQRAGCLNQPARPWVAHVRQAAHRHAACGAPESAAHALQP